MNPVRVANTLLNTQYQAKVESYCQQKKMDIRGMIYIMDLPLLAAGSALG